MCLNSPHLNCDNVVQSDNSTQTFMNKNCIFLDGSYIPHVLDKKIENFTCPAEFRYVIINPKGIGKKSNYSTSSYNEFVFSSKNL